MYRVLMFLLLLLPMVGVGQQQMVTVTFNGESYALNMEKIERAIPHPDGGSILIYAQSDQSFRTSQDVDQFVASTCSNFILVNVDGVALGINVAHIEKVSEASDGRAVIRYVNVADRVEADETYVSVLADIIDCGTGGGSSPPQFLDFNGSPVLCLTQGNCVDLSEINTDDQAIETLSYNEETGKLSIKLENSELRDVTITPGTGSGEGDDWGDQVVITDETIGGNGTPSSPLTNLFDFRIFDGLTYQTISDNDVILFAGGLGMKAEVLSTDRVVYSINTDGAENNEVLTFYNGSLTWESVTNLTKDFDWLASATDEAALFNTDDIYTEGNVGIGVVSPNKRLEIKPGEIVLDGQNVSAEPSIEYKTDNQSWTTKLDGFAYVFSPTSDNNWIIEDELGNPVMSMSTGSKNVSLHGYPNSRVDTEDVVNFLYTDAGGTIRSRPIEDIVGEDGGGSGDYVFENGLTETSGTVEWGGFLLRNTTINQSGFDVIYSNADEYSIYQSGGDYFTLDASKLELGTSSGARVTMADGDVTYDATKTYWKYGTQVIPVGSMLQMVDAGTREIKYGAYTFPIEQSEEGYVLVTDGSGNLQWELFEGGGSGGTEYSFGITDGTVTQPIADGDQITYVGENLLISEVSAVDRVEYRIDDTGANEGDVITFSEGVVQWGGGGSGGSDADWYKVGSSLAPSSIEDDQFTLGKVGIGQDPDEQLTVAGDISTNGTNNGLYLISPSSSWKMSTSGSSMTVQPQNSNGNFDITSQGNVNRFRIYMSNGNIRAQGYPNGRDDSNAESPINFLYTDATGDVLSAPLSTIISESGDDHDFYEVGSTVSPDNINDNQYTQGFTGFGTSDPTSRIHLQNGILRMTNNGSNSKVHYENSLNTWEVGQLGQTFRFKPENDADFAIDDASGEEKLRMELASGDLTLNSYPKTRDNSATYPPENFLYTNTVGDVLSAPFEQLGGGGSFTVTDGSNTQVIEQNDFLEFGGSNLIGVEISPTDQVSHFIDASTANPNDVIKFVGGSVVWAQDGGGENELTVGAMTGLDQVIDLETDVLQFTGQNLIVSNTVSPDEIAYGIDITGASTNSVIVFNGTEPEWGPSPASGSFIIKDPDGDNETVNFDEDILFSSTELISIDVDPTRKVSYGINTSGATENQVITYDGTTVVWQDAVGASDIEAENGLTKVDGSPAKIRLGGSTDSNTSIAAGSSSHVFTYFGFAEFYVTGETFTFMGDDAEIDALEEMRFKLPDWGAAPLGAVPQIISTQNASVKYTPFGFPNTVGGNGQVLVLNEGTNMLEWGNSGGMSSFNVTADGGPVQTITEGNTLDFDGLGVVDVRTLNTDKVTVDISPGLDNQVLTTQGSSVLWANAASGADNWGSGNFIVSNGATQQTVDQGEDLKLTETGVLNIVLGQLGNNHEYTFSINPGTQGQVLTTDGGSVVWADGDSFGDDWGAGKFIASGDTGSEDVLESDVLAVTGSSVLVTEASKNGSTVTIDVDITAGLNDQVLKTVNGVVQWEDDLGGTDDWGNGNFQVSDGVVEQDIDDGDNLIVEGFGVVSTSLTESGADNTIEISITPGLTGQVLTTGAGVVAWANQAGGADDWGNGTFTVTDQIGSTYTAIENSNINFLGGGVISSEISGSGNDGTVVYSILPGADGEVLQTSLGVATWQPLSTFGDGFTVRADVGSNDIAENDIVDIAGSGLISTEATVAGNVTNVEVSLNEGLDGQVLTTISGVPTWAASQSGADGWGPDKWFLGDDSNTNIGIDPSDLVDFRGQPGILSSTRTGNGTTMVLTYNIVPGSNTQVLKTVNGAVTWAADESGDDWGSGSFTVSANSGSDLVIESGDVFDFDVFDTSGGVLSTSIAQGDVEVGFTGGGVGLYLTRNGSGNYAWQSISGDGWGSGFWEVIGDNTGSSQIGEGESLEIIGSGVIETLRQEINGDARLTVSMQSGTNGQVLTMVGGAIAWADASGGSTVTASNGLTETSGNIKLGGGLIEDTDIDIAGNELSILDGAVEKLDIRGWTRLLYDEGNLIRLQNGASTIRAAGADVFDAGSSQTRVMKGNSQLSLSDNDVTIRRGSTFLLTGSSAQTFLKAPDGTNIVAGSSNSTSLIFNNSSFVSGSALSTIVRPTNASASDSEIKLEGDEVSIRGEISGSAIRMLLRSNSLILENLPTTSVTTGLNTNEVYVTSGHATLPDGVLVIGQ